MRRAKRFFFNHLAHAFRSESNVFASRPLAKMHNTKTAGPTPGRARYAPRGAQREYRNENGIGALALVMVMSAPALAQRSPSNYGYQNPSFYNNQSPASPNYGGNGY